jgi:hypothetical protein
VNQNWWGFMTQVNQNLAVFSSHRGPIVRFPSIRLDSEIEGICSRLEEGALTKNKLHTWGENPTSA